MTQVDVVECCGSEKHRGKMAVTAFFLGLGEGGKDFRKSSSLVSCFLRGSTFHLRSWGLICLGCGCSGFLMGIF